MRNNRIGAFKKILVSFILSYFLTLKNIFKKLLCSILINNWFEICWVTIILYLFRTKLQIIFSNFVLFWFYPLKFKILDFGPRHHIAFLFESFHEYPLPRELKIRLAQPLSEKRGFEYHSVLARTNKKSCASMQTRTVTLLFHLRWNFGPF